MSEIRVRAATVFVFMSLCSGCAGTRSQVLFDPESRGLPGPDSPRFVLSLPDEPTVSTVSSHVEPHFVLSDHRSDLEKHYYPGDADIHHWRDAVTVFPMECLEPDVERLLKKRVLALLDSPTKYESATLEVHSFFVTLDERDRRQKEFRASLAQWEQDVKRKTESGATEWWRDRNCDDFGDYVASGLFRMAFVDPTEKHRYRRERAAQALVHPQTLPKRFTDVATPGWNCVVKTVLVLAADSDQNVVRVPADVRLTVEHDEAQSPKEQVPTVVLEAVTALQQELRVAVQDAHGASDVVRQASLDAVAGSHHADIP